jgi:ribosome-binding factor A
LITVGSGQRIDRVAEEFREILAEELPRLKDPRVGFVTVTHVRVTPDLRRAVVYYTVLGEDRDHARTRAGLRSATPRLRSILGHAIRLRYTPELEFLEDVGQANVERVAGLLREIGSAGGPEAPGGGGRNGDGDPDDV